MDPEFTVGVEEEYQLVDPTTGALRSRARDVLSLDWTDEVHGELHQSMVEINTRICGSAVDLLAEIRRLRFQVATIVAAEAVQIAAAGCHPFTRWEGQPHMPDERYARLLKRYGRIAWDELNFGMHVHVALPSGQDRAVILNRVRPFLPHLLALSCSSPFFEGADTGFSSYRVVLWRRWPYAGMPPLFESEDHYTEVVEGLLGAGVIEDARNVYWNVRIHPVYPTLEFRITDVCPRIDDAVAIATLIRAVVFAAAEDRLPACTSRDDGLTHTLLSSNEWLAARHGLHATLLDPNSQWREVDARTAVEKLIDRVEFAARALGDWDELRESIDALLRRGTASERMRRAHRQGGGFPALMQWLTTETLLGTGLDRRREQRELLA